MKSRIEFLLFICGAILAAFTHLVDIPTIVLFIIGGFALGFAHMMYNSIYSGSVWGIKIKPTSSGRIKQVLSIIGIIIGGYTTYGFVIFVITRLLSFSIVELLINTATFAVFLAIAPFVAKVVGEKSLAKESNAMILGELDIFKQIDNNMSEAKFFVVSYEGIALYSATNYCYAVYLYDDYKLGSLSTPEEVALVGTYFIQKYHRDYTFEVDIEVVPTEVGETVFAFGSHRVTVSQTTSTNDQRIFRSYLFERKK